MSPSTRNIVYPKSDFLGVDAGRGRAASVSPTFLREGEKEDCRV